MGKRGNWALGLAAICCSWGLFGAAAASAGTLSASVPTIDFGPVAVATGTNQAIGLTNTGTATTVTAVTLGGTDPGDFEVVTGDDGCDGAVLDDEGECTVTLAFLPTITGPRAATLVVTATSDDPPDSELQVPLQGTGVAPELALAPSPFDFGTVAVGSKSPERAFTVANTGTDAAAIGAVALSGADPDQFAIGADTCASNPLPQGGECSVGVVFAPTVAGAKSATLEVPSNDPGSPATVSITGTGASPPPSGGGGGPAPPAPAVAAAAAPVKPSNFFSFGKVIKIRGRGTASLSVRVPGPGVVVLGGKGVLARKGAGAALVLGGAGTARLAIAAAGRKRAALNRTGRARVTARVTYTPFGGDPLTKVKKIKLSKRRR